jgi:hypothetical protein
MLRCRRRTRFMAPELQRCRLVAGVKTSGCTRRPNCYALRVRTAGFRSRFQFMGEWHRDLHHAGVGVGPHRSEPTTFKRSSATVRTTEGICPPRTQRPRRRSYGMSAKWHLHPVTHREQTQQRQPGGHAGLGAWRVTAKYASRSSIATDPRGSAITDSTGL